MRQVEPQKYFDSRFQSHVNVLHYNTITAASSPLTPPMTPRLDMTGSSLISNIIPYFRLQRLIPMGYL